MIDHYALLVTDFDRSLDFYLKALAPLGYSIAQDITREQVPSLPFARVTGLGVGGKPDLWLQPSKTVSPTHIALVARTRGEVDAFHRAALAAGATDNGAPGPRPHYHANYYGAFVLDPDGYNLEAVCHGPK